jgi:hypothetical protein
MHTGRVATDGIPALQIPVRMFVVTGVTAPNVPIINTADLVNHGVHRGLQFLDQAANRRQSILEDLCQFM